jgi:hypothetical protein
LGGESKGEGWAEALKKVKETDELLVPERVALRADVKFKTQSGRLSGRTFVRLQKLALSFGTASATSLHRALFCSTS